MSLPHALLIALIERPGSGLELSDRFDRSIGNFWHATHQQIYRELARLEAAGWAEATPVEAARGGKKQYRVVAAGRRELLRWTGRARDIEPYRSELMLRMRAEAVMGPSGLEAEVERHLAMHRTRLADYREIEKRSFSEPDLSRSAAISYLILKKGIMNETAWIEWLLEALLTLRRESGAAP